jgi:TRAP-type C4-dicarboxylate transport system substrate-binding protein
MHHPLRAVLRSLAHSCWRYRSPSARKPITLHGAVQFNDGHAFNRALEKFQELTVKYYGKPVNFVLHKNSELGLEKDYFAYMNQGIPSTTRSCLPRTCPRSRRPLRSSTRRSCSATRPLEQGARRRHAEADRRRGLAKGDVMLIGFAGGGTRNIFANKPVRNLAEMKGLKVRVQGAPIWSKTFAAVGMSPTVIAYDEIYNASRTA